MLKQTMNELLTNHNLRGDCKYDPWQTFQDQYRTIVPMNVMITIVEWILIGTP